MLALARKIVGSDIPIVLTLDLHANVTRRMVEQADAIVGYHTYPSAAKGLPTALPANAAKEVRAIASVTIIFFILLIFIGYYFFFCFFL